MKVRSSFVSNSSSSSYVIGVARVTDEEKLEKFCRENGLDEEVYTTKEALEAKGWSKPTRTYGDKTYFSCEAFNGDEVSVLMDTEKDEKFVTISDCQSIEEDENGPVDPGGYDSAILDLKEEHGVTNIEVSCGYGLI